MKKSTKKRTYKRKNIVGNFKGAEDIFWTKVVNGVEKFFESPFCLCVKHLRSIRRKGVKRLRKKNEC